MTSPAAMQVRHLFAFCVFPLLCFVLIELLFVVQTGLWLELELELELDFELELELEHDYMMLFTCYSTLFRCYPTPDAI